MFLEVKKICPQLEEADKEAVAMSVCWIFGNFTPLHDLCDSWV